MTQKNEQQHPAAPKAEQSVEGAVRRSGLDPAKTYHGKPCKNCGGTLRWNSDRSCAECKKRRQREYCTDPKYRERRREYMREWNRKNGSDAQRKQRDERILADPTIQEFLRMQDPLVKKLEAMIANAGASQGEKDNAYRILERKGLLPTSNRRHAWLRRQTTFGATPNTQHEMKSLPS